ncbi:MAG: ligase-associated DNA damage response exonuclease [Bacteroidia bacterium]|jgi:putative mRNA 3-end processing factor|nr:ligase-associated DNA damage response exonuclease [Bacteroidia bacterium]
MRLLEFTTSGIYCALGDFYIDPWKPVARALITHAHSDHARWGMQHYVAHRLSVPVMKQRIGSGISVQAVEYYETLQINGVTVSFHPAGHIPGSSQIRVEYKGEVWVASGDYKLGADGISTPFEPVRCHTFISESTFGLPVYHWKPQHEIISEINEWWQQCAAAGKTALIYGYALGKAQRIMQAVDESIGPMYVHGAVHAMNEALREGGLPLRTPSQLNASISKADLRGALVIAPPAAGNEAWLNRLQPCSTAGASGWMGLRGARRRMAYDRGFVLSDHADWKQLNTAVEACHCERVIVTHGYTSVFARWLQGKGLQAEEARTEYAGELHETVETQTVTTDTDKP